MKISSALKKVIFVFLVTFASIYIDLPKELPINIDEGGFKVNTVVKRGELNFRLGRFELKRNLDLVLGLDLAGGSHLVFEVQTEKLSSEKKKPAIDGVREVIERRVNLFGISEPNVQTSSFQGKERILVELPGIKDTKSAIDLIGKTAQLVFAEVPESTSEGSLKPTDLTGADLSDARVAFDPTSGKPVVSIQFSKEGGDKFEKITEKNVGRPLAIILDNTLVSAPTVQETIKGGNAQITGSFTLEEAKKLSIQLNAGALPVPIQLVEERTVGATLGKDSIERSVRAGAIGLVMVMTFMILSYGKLGIVANLGLLIYGALTLALYKLIPVTLTLPGVAGFLLSVGMAVDSNILIFERLKEEVTRRPYREALEVSFGRAWDSIRDANIATLVTAFILANPFDWSFLHTSGPVRGFAITLALGIGISLFTGVVVSRNLLRVFTRRKES